MALLGHDPSECSDEARAGALMVADFMSAHLSFNDWLVKSLAGDGSKGGNRTRLSKTKRWFK